MGLYGQIIVISMTHAGSYYNSQMVLANATKLVDVSHIAVVGTFWGNCHSGTPKHSLLNFIFIYHYTRSFSLLLSNLNFANISNMVYNSADELAIIIGIPLINIPYIIKFIDAINSNNKNMYEIPFVFFVFNVLIT